MPSPDAGCRMPSPDAPTDAAPDAVAGCHGGAAYDVGAGGPGPALTPVASSSKLEVIIQSD